MSTKPIFLSCQPDNDYFLWQLEVQLHNFKKFGYTEDYHVVLFTPGEKEINTKFYDLAARYPEAHFFFYKDEGFECKKLIDSFGYVSLIRPWTLKTHFKKYPELAKVPIFYTDSDVIFTKYLDFTPFLQDDINYLSNTESYVGASYFDSKIKDVIPRKLERYKQRDVLDETAKMVGINREICVANQANTGGAQYLLKGINSKFWADVLDSCMFIKTHLHAVNQQFFESEDKGFQSWCADMWAVLWNLWKRGMETRCPKELDFAWASDRISRWDEVYLYHDAGAERNFEIDSIKHWPFNKRGRRIEPIKGQFAYSDEYRMPPYLHPANNDNSWVTKEFCTYKYLQELLETFS